MLPTDYFQNKLEVVRNAKDSKLMLICHFSLLSNYCTFGFVIEMKMKCFRKICMLCNLKILKRALPLSVCPLLQDRLSQSSKWRYISIVKEASTAKAYKVHSYTETTNINLPLNLYSHQSKLRDYVRRQHEISIRTRH